MNEDLAKQLANILNDKNIDLNQILQNFKANSSEENTENTEEIKNSENQSDTRNINTENKNFNLEQFDINTILKMQKILKLIKNDRFQSRRKSIKSTKALYEKLQKRKDRSIHKTTTNPKNIRKIQRNGRQHK